MAPQQNELAGIMDLIGKIIPAPFNILASTFPNVDIRKPLVDQLTKAKYSLESKAGEFLQTGQTISDSIYRARKQLNSDKSDVRSRAKALEGIGMALLNQYESVKVESQNGMNKIASLAAILRDAPEFKFTNFAQMGTRVIQLFNQRRAEILGTATAVGGVVARISKHVSETKKFSADVNALENAAQGKGVGSIIGNIGTGVLDSAIEPAVKILAVGAAVWLFAPSLLGRTLRR